MASKPNYDPYKLLKDIQEILRSKGLEPQPVDGVDRVSLARNLLQAYGIDPVVQPESVLDLDGHASYNRRIHGD